MDGRPPWARRITTEREARGWNKPQFIEALRAHSKTELPGKESMVRRVHSWESGASCPDDFYKPLIAQAFGTVTWAIWPAAGSRDADAELVAGTGMDTLEVLTRLRGSSIDAATLEGLRITVDRLCSEYPYLPAQQLLIEGRSWLRRITTMLDRQLTLRQHGELLSMAGWLAALVGCVEYDSTNRAAAEAIRQTAWSLGEESGNTEVMAWAQEMRAWFALTRGDYRGVPSSCTRRRPRRGPGSAIGGKSRSPSTKDAPYSNGCPTRRTSTTTSPSIPRSGTSTRWTATGSWAAATTRAAPRTGSPSRTRPRSSG